MGQQKEVKDKREKDALQDLHEIGKKHHGPASIVKEAAHVAEVTTNMLHRAHIGLLGILHFLEQLLPPLRLGLVGITSIWEALNAVYFSQKSIAHRGAQIVIAVASTIAVIIGLAIPHAALAMLITYASVELFREFTHFFEAVKDFWQLRKLKHELSREKLRHIRRFIIEKSVDIVFGAVAVVGAVLILFSSAAFLGVSLPLIGMGLLVLSGAGALLFRAGLGIAHVFERRAQAKKAVKAAQAGEVKPGGEERWVAPGLVERVKQQNIKSHESTMDIYHLLDLLKEEANRKRKLRTVAWTIEPLESQKRTKFWADHRYVPYRVPRPVTPIEGEEGEGKHLKPPIGR